MAKMMTDIEVSQVLGLARQTLRAWRVSGKGPKFSKFGVSVRYDERDVNKWSEERGFRATHEKVEPSKAGSWAAGEPPRDGRWYVVSESLRFSPLLMAKWLGAGWTRWDDGTSVVPVAYLRKAIVLSF